MTLPRRMIRIQDLADDPAVFAAYDAAHRPGATPPEVLAAQRRHGILDLEIYRHADRLVMILTIAEDFDPAGLDAESAITPALVAWHRRMATLQRRPSGGDQDWPEATLVFRQSDHP
ncbi:L-rhamnose mutarotase [Sphingomonas azotifigens]|uniref:L-rhamnose mutarotase n=1 Tax=Sphingomonas azotifigens TaxID=330920 RepID=UPI000A02560B|nr:L-rhamnose mutarotase [Sphingomonas azotifigens]